MKKYFSKKKNLQKYFTVVLRILYASLKKKKKFLRITKIFSKMLLQWLRNIICQFQIFEFIIMF